ncbi:MAG: hypothetical protein Q9218_000123 [Villophora microphyllina]
MSNSSRVPSVDREVNFASPSREQSQPPLSKNKLKKLRRDQAWEEGRERRKELRKLKKEQKKEKKRAAAADDEHTLATESTIVKRKASDDAEALEAKKPKYEKATQLPVSFVIDCGFDDLMLDGERKSLASQITRSYSDNHKASFRSHLSISSFGRHLKERFDTVLSGHHHNWKGVKFVEGDFEEAARQAHKHMMGAHGGSHAGAFANNKVSSEATEPPELEVVYLTSDSPDILTELRPYTTYVIGGLVDKNRHKGICYKRAMDRGVETARLPISDYMQMASRSVLATNHVVEIMLRWLELGDWGKAFLEVVPKRKGGVLKDGVLILDETTEGAKHDEPARNGSLEEPPMEEPSTKEQTLEKAVVESHQPNPPPRAENAGKSDEE